MIDIIRKQQQLESTVEVSTNAESADAAITLTRTALQAITTAGTVITWQQQTRGQQITWSTTDVTIPTSGYYLLQTRFATSANCTMFQQVVLNGTTLGYFASTDVASTFHTGMHMRYFASNDVIRIRLVPSINVNVTLSAENTLLESPILHITQLTRGTV